VAEIRRYYASIFTAVAGGGRSEARDRNGLQILNLNQCYWAETRGSRVQLLTRDSAGRTYPFGPIPSYRMFRHVASTLKPKRSLGYGVGFNTKGVCTL